MDICLVDLAHDQMDVKSLMQLVATITHQSHLCPLPLSVQPIIWNYDHCLRLYPTPHTVCVSISFSWCYGNDLELVVNSWWHHGMIIYFINWSLLESLYKLKTRRCIMLKHSVWYVQIIESTGVLGFSGSLCKWVGFAQATITFSAYHESKKWKNWLMN